MLVTIFPKPPTMPFTSFPTCFQFPVITSRISAMVLPRALNKPEITPKVPLTIATNMLNVGLTRGTISSNVPRTMAPRATNAAPKTLPITPAISVNTFLLAINHWLIPSNFSTTACIGPPLSPAWVNGAIKSFSESFNELNTLPTFPPNSSNGLANLLILSPTPSNILLNRVTNGLNAFVRAFQLSPNTSPIDIPKTTNESVMGFIASLNELKRSPATFATFPKALPTLLTIPSTKPLNFSLCLYNS